MILEYGLEIDNEVIANNIRRLTNQVFKLLPSREEGEEWMRPLQNLIIELAGMKNLLPDQEEFFQLLCKLEGLKDLNGEDDFLQFRKTIFECLSLLTKIKNSYVKF